MRDRPAPAFDDWVNYTFTHAHADFSDESGDPVSVVADREDRLACLEAKVATQYLTRLFEDPAFIADQFTDKQIADAMWYIFGVASQYFFDVQSAEVPDEAQIRCIDSVATLYRELLDRVCGHRGSEPDINLCNTEDLDIAVYMIWDMDSIEGTVMFPERNPHLVEPGIKVLQSILEDCSTSTCHASALHAIGSLICYHDYGGDQTIRNRLRQMVDAFTAGRTLPEWVRDYAEGARIGAFRML